MRKAYSSPKTDAQALKWRVSKKWKIADASFKLFDKYGYLAILRKFAELHDVMEAGDAVDEESIETLLSTVKEYINNADKLSEQEVYEGQLSESFVKTAFIAALLAVPNLMPQTAVAAALKNVPKS